MCGRIGLILLWMLLIFVWRRGDVCYYYFVCWGEVIIYLEGGGGVEGGFYYLGERGCGYVEVILVIFGCDFSGKWRLCVLGLKLSCWVILGVRLEVLSDGWWFEKFWVLFCWDLNFLWE